MEALDPIEVRRYGAGERTVVVLHGGPGAPGSASGLGHTLAPHFQVLELLQRRSGLVPLTVSQHVEDLAAVAPRPATLIGWSWGAMLGLSFAARFRSVLRIWCSWDAVPTNQRPPHSLNERWISHLATKDAGRFARSHNVSHS